LVAGIVQTRAADGRRRVLERTALYYLSFIALGLSSASFGPTLPGLAQHTGSRLNEISFLFTARALGYLIGSFRGGRLYDRFKQGQRIMAACLVGMSVCLAIIPTLPWLWLLTGVLFMLGVMEAGLDVGGNVLLVRVHGERVDPFMNGLHFFFGIGAVLSPIIVARALLLSGDIGWAYWILAMLYIPVAGWLFRSPSPASPDHAETQENGRPLPGLVILLACMFGLFVGVEVGIGGWIFTYATTMGIASGTAAYLTSTYWGAFTAARLIGIPISARVAPGPILLADLLICLTGPLTIVLWPGSQTALWVGAFLAGLGMASIFPTGLALAQRRMRLTGKVTGILLVGGSAGSMLLPWLVGQAFERIGPLSFLWIMIVSLLLALALLAVFTWFAASSQKTARRETQHETLDSSP